MALPAQDIVQRLSYEELYNEVQRGAKFVQYQYVISLLVVTFRRSSKVFYIPPGESAVAPGIPYSLLSFFLGWWGFPWGVMRTPLAIGRNLSGGIDVTEGIMQRLRAAAWAEMTQ